ncbi:uncharacterized protein LOC117112386 [Anneissia japonica]|uniref:uncharacterized protein LOC117112386 n=1 Tax=Anneissia japonica TaxID=1529436 RepID=UPI001425B4FD|nr:uncharacterized protein LOC117112386 [Anneissia japonica]
MVFSHQTPLDCTNTSASRQIQIQNLLNTSKFMTLCRIHDEIECSYKDISSQCVGHRLKRTTTSLLSSDVGVMFTFIAKSSNVDLLDQMLKAINTSINDLWPGSEPYLTINGDRATLAPSISSKGQVQAICPGGQNAVNYRCGNYILKYFFYFFLI